MNSLILVPQPRHLELGSGSFRLEPGKRIALVGAPAQQQLLTGEWLRQALRSTCGVGCVYLDFLLKIYREVKARGRAMMFWGDIVNQHPNLLAGCRRMPSRLNGAMKRTFLSRQVAVNSPLRAFHSTSARGRARGTRLLGALTT